MRIIFLNLICLFGFFSYCFSSDISISPMKICQNDNPIISCNLKLPAGGVRFFGPSLQFSINNLPPLLASTINSAAYQDVCGGGSIPISRLTANVTVELMSANIRNMNGTLSLTNFQLSEAGIEIGCVAPYTNEISQLTEKITLKLTKADSPMSTVINQSSYGFTTNESCSGPITINWSNVQSDRELSYKVNINSQNYSSTITQMGNSTQYTTGKLPLNKLSYNFSVTAVSCAGSSPPTYFTFNPLVLEVPKTPAFGNTPTISTLMPQNCSSQLTFNIAPKLNFRNVTKYRVYDDTQLISTLQANLASNTYQVMHNLRPGYTHTFTVSAENCAGSSSPSVITNFVLPYVQIQDITGAVFTTPTRVLDFNLGITTPNTLEVEYVIEATVVLDSISVTQTLFSGNVMAPFSSTESYTLESGVTNVERIAVSVNKQCSYDVVISISTNTISISNTSTPSTQSLSSGSSSVATSSSQPVGSSTSSSNQPVGSSTSSGSSSTSSGSNVGSSSSTETSSENFTLTPAANIQQFQCGVIPCEAVIGISAGTFFFMAIIIIIILIVAIIICLVIRKNKKVVNLNQYPNSPTVEPEREEIKALTEVNPDCRTPTRFKENFDEPRKENEYIISDNEKPSSEVVFKDDDFYNEDDNLKSSSKEDDGYENFNYKASIDDADDKFKSQIDDDDNRSPL